MKITRNTLRADGKTVGQALDEDAAFLNELGIAAPIGQMPFDEAEEVFVDKCRKAVLDALDDVAEETTGERKNGPKDSDLPELFAGIDPIAKRMFAKRYGL